MKMRYIVVITLCTLLAVAWYFRDSGFRVQQQDAAFLVPRDAIFFAEQKDIGTLIESVQKSRLGKALASIDFQQIGQDVGLSQGDLSTLQQTLDVVKELSSNKLFREFCGKSVALALLPTDSVPTAGTVKSPPPHFQALLIAKPQHKAEIFELISSMYSGDVQQTETVYENFTIKHLQVENTTIFAAIVDGFFLLSMDEQTLRRALDASRQADKSLAQNEAFEKLKKQFLKPELMVFCALDGLRQQLAQMVNQGSPSIPKEFADQLASTTGLQYSAYGIWRDKGLLRDLSITLVDPAKFGPFIGQMLSISPEHNDTLGFVPENIVTYYWSNTFALSTMWKMYVEKNKADTTEINKLKTLFKKNTGRDVPEVLSLIDGGMSLFMKNGDPKAFLPLPHFAILIKLKDRKAMENLLRTVVVEHGIPLQDTTYKKVTYSSYAFTLQGGLEALYGFQDNFLILANSSDVMQDIIDTRESGKGLQAGKAYAKMAINLEEGNNSVSFIRMAELIGGIKEVLGWSGAMLAVQDRETAEKTRIIIAKLINPLLDGMTMVSTISTRSHLTREQIVVESTILLKPTQETH